MARYIALIAVLAIAACAAPTTKGPRTINDALREAHERGEVMPTDR